MRRLLVVFLLLSLGAGMAYGLDSALRLSWTPAQVMPEPPTAVPQQRTAVAPAIGVVTLNRHTHRLDTAARAVTAAGQNAKGVLTVTVTGDSDDESYRLDRAGSGFTLTAAGSPAPRPACTRSATSCAPAYP